MPIKPNQLKKFSMKQLKDIMKKNNIKGVSGNKGNLIERISSSPQFNTIKESLSLPDKVKRVFSKAQIEAQERFKQARKKKPILKDLSIKPIKSIIKPIISKVENIERENVIDEIIEIKDNKQLRDNKLSMGSMKEENKILRSMVRLLIGRIF